MLIVLKDRHTVVIATKQEHKELRYISINKTVSIPLNTELTISKLQAIFNKLIKE